MNTLDRLRLELSVQCKNGVNFILAAIVCWLLIAILWTLPYPAKTRAMWTFFATMPLLPLAWILSKILKTAWNVPNNPLAPLGLWLNFAQLFYFPFVIMAAYRAPETMPTALAIITGAHFFPYAWFYRSMGYAVMAGVMTVTMPIVSASYGALNPLVVPLTMAALLGIMALWITFNYIQNKKEFDEAQAKSSEL